jgi:hypothetical protein
LPPLQAAGDTVGLEIVFLKLPADAPSEIAPMWDEIDETPLPVDLRRRLAANGVRCGLFGTQMPTPLKQLIDDLTVPAADDLQEGLPVSAGPVQTCRRLQSRTGQRSELLASDVLPEMAVLLARNGQVGGQTYREAQCMWALTTTAQAAGRVRLQLTPEVHYGQPQNQYVGQSSGIFRQITARPRETFDDLRIETLLSPGQTLVLAATDPVRGLGQHFFAYGAGTQAAGQKLLLVRLARTQYDDLFSADPILAPIASATE